MGLNRDRIRDHKPIILDDINQEISLNELEDNKESAKESVEVNLENVELEIINEEQVCDNIEQQDDNVEIINLYTEESVVCIDTEVVYEDNKHASEETGISANGIKKCCDGKQKTAGKMRWAYSLKYFGEK